MKLFIQIVNYTAEITNEEISFFSQYKDWIFLSLILFLIISILLYKRKKILKFIAQSRDIILRKPNKTTHDTGQIITSKSVNKENVVKLKRDEKPVTEKRVIKEKSVVKVEKKEKKSKKVKNLEETIVENKRSKKKTARKPQKVIVTKEPLIEEIASKEEKVNSKIKVIGFQITTVFEQGENYHYPQVLMPKLETNIKFPRKGCSNKTGYTEDAFFEYMQNPFAKDFQLYNDRHIPSKNGKFVYEPDIVLINEKNGKNIFIDIEIDEPYEGFSRTPTHERGVDLIRNKFFTDRGWIVIRFSERQIHENPKECCYHIAKVIAAIDADYEIPFHVTLYGDLEDESSWDSLQAKKWAKQKYREEYLGIESFGVRPNITSKYIIDISENDALIENEIIDEVIIPKHEKIEGVLAKNEHKRDNRLRFDPIKHHYFIDDNPDTISVSQLIAKFFPKFDSEYWSRKKAKERLKANYEKITEENVLRMQEIILVEWKTKGENAANLGTELHKAIEDYYNGLVYKKETPEFKYFLKFKERYATMKPYRGEWRVFDEEYLIAGTIDMVYQKDGNEFYMFDWKRSKKVVDDQGNPKLPSYDYASGELSHLSDNSYNKYAIQQNIYKYILEKRYDKKITSMNLLILHPNFDTYHLVKLPDLTKEVEYIFENSKHYR